MKHKIIYIFIPLLLFLLVLVLYSFTLPNVNTGYADSDELITVAKILGVPHPPGYPFYTVLAAIVGRLPIPFLNFAGKVNFLNTLLHSLTVILVYYCSWFLSRKLIKDFRLRLVCSCIAALSLAFMFSFWFYAVITEVFSLNNFLAALIFTILVYWEYQPRDKLLLLAAFIFGLGVGNQQVILFLAPLYILLVIFSNWKIVLDWKLLLKSFAAFLAGLLLPYIYVFYAAVQQTVINWENVHDFNSVYRLITRRIYAEAAPTGTAYAGGHFDLHHVIQGSINFFAYLSSNYGPLLVILGIVGISYVLLTRNYQLAVLLLAGIIGGGWFFSIYALFTITPDQPYYEVIVGVHQRFLLSAAIFFSLCIGIGSIALIELLRKKIVIVIICLFLLWSGYSDFHDIKQLNFSLGHQFGKTLLESLDKNAILLCFSEHSCFTGTYLQQVEGVRKDVLIIPADFAQYPAEQLEEQHPGLIKTTVQRTSSKRSVLLARDLIRWNIDKRPLYLSGIVTDISVISAYGLDRDPFYLVPQGCAMKISRLFTLGPKVNPCQSIEEEAVHSHFSNKAPISFMFNNYFMYQHYLNAITYSQYGCRKSANSELQTASKLSTSTALKNFAKEAEKDAEVDRCYGHTLSALSDKELVKEAQNAEKKGDAKSAIYLANQAVSVDPEDINNRLYLAYLYIKVGAYANALVEYQDMLVLDPNNQSIQQDYLRIKNIMGT